MPALPVILQYEGEGVFRAPSRFVAARCDRDYVIGERYRMAEEQERSMVSHRHEFAFVRHAWQSLPEQYAMEPWAQSEDHLRKYALIRTRFCTTEQFPCASRAEAIRLAAILRADDSYCLVTVAGAIVNRFRAESQSKRSMGAKRFHASKQAILEFLSDLIGVASETLARQSKAA